MTGRLLCAFLLLAAASAQAQGERRYFRSNALGMRLGELTALSGQGWELGVRRTGIDEQTILYENGEEARRWETRRSGPGQAAVTREYEAGRLSVVSTYARDGRLSEEKVFEGEALREQILYTYQAGRLATVETRNARREFLHRDTYHYSRDGSLREVLRTYADGQERRSLYGALGNLLVEEYHSGPDYQMHLRYNEIGLPVLQREWRSGRLEKSTTFAYHEGSRSVRETRTVHEREGREELALYNRDGELEVREVRVAGRLVERSRYTHDRGLLRRVETSEAKRTTVIDYEYDAAGRLEIERHSIGGELVRRIVHLEGDERIEEHYRGGRLVLRAHYQGAQLVREEIVIAGGAR